uniref:Uncharacterized protein n=1 Tax=Triticum urartu TaxID=4572 RepID=A0A8R7TKF8_TRIUA
MALRFMHAKMIVLLYNHCGTSCVSFCISVNILSVGHI